MLHSLNFTFHVLSLAPVEWVASLLLSTILVVSLSARQAGTDRSSPSFLPLSNDGDCRHVAVKVM